MDFKAISATIKDRFEVEIFHPGTGEGGWIFTLAGPSHASSQDKVLEILDRIKKRRFSTPAQAEKDGIDLICARILGWKGLMEGDDEVPFTPETAAAILADPTSFWVRSQLLEAIGDPTRPFKS